MAMTRDDLLRLLADLEEMKECANIRCSNRRPGHLTRVKRDNNFNYYHNMPRENDKRGRRIGITGSPDIIEELAWNMYDRTLVDILKKDISALCSLLEGYVDPGSCEVLRAMKPAQREMIEDVLFKTEPLGKLGIYSNSSQRRAITIKIINGMDVSLDELASIADQTVLDIRDGEFFVKKNLSGGRDIELSSLGNPANPICLPALSPDVMRKIQSAWSIYPFKQSSYRPEDKAMITSRGLQVRSKAEVLIAEMLYKNSVPFRYEQVLVFDEISAVPDFTFLGRDGNPFFWEYCGMMDDPQYVRNYYKKRSLYEQNGILPWKNVIYTFDMNNEINVAEIEGIITNTIVPRL